MAEGKGEGGRDASLWSVSFSCENSPKNPRVPGCSRIFTILLTHNSHMPRETGADFLASCSRRKPETCARLTSEGSAPSFIKTLFYSQLDARRVLCHVLVRFFSSSSIFPRERFCPFDRDKEALGRVRLTCPATESRWDLFNYRLDKFQTSSD